MSNPKINNINVGGVDYEIEGSNIPPDAALDSTSINSLQNKVITNKFVEIDAELSELSDYDLSNYTALTYSGALNQGQSYVNTDLWQVPADAKEILVGFAKEGTIGGIYKLFKNGNTVAIDYSLNRAIFGYNRNTNSVYLSYVYVTDAGNVTYFCWYR